MSDPDTIVALSTPAGASRRGVIRISGTRAIRIVQRLVRPAAALEGTWVHRPVSLSLGGDWPPVPASVFVMRSPRSYTREDVVELHLHGAPMLVRAVIRHLTALPAVREAEPGEFTRRAYLSGRLDASQVAAVLDLVRARHVEAARVAASALQGEATDQIALLRAAVLRLVARLEAHLDFTDDDAAQLSVDELTRDLAHARETCGRALESLDVQTFDESIRLALIGEPNAGKTSLFNRLTGRDAIVSEHPGTTRDVGEASLDYQGWRFTIWDTAGWRTTTDELEQQAGSLAREAAERADLRFEILDGTAERLPNLELDWAADALVIHKVDQPRRLDLVAVHRRAAGRPVLQVSARTGFGVDELLSTARRLAEAGSVERTASSLQLAAGHEGALRDIETRLGLAGQRISPAGDELELAAFELREAIERLSDLGAPVHHDEILDVLFRQFCIGK